jgi:hypothetical protein
MAVFLFDACLDIVIYCHQHAMNLQTGWLPSAPRTNKAEIRNERGVERRKQLKGEDRKGKK